MHVWGHEASSQLLTLWIRGGSRESHWICDCSGNKKNAASFEDSLQDAYNWWSCQYLQQGVTHVWRTDFRVRECPAQRLKDQQNKHMWRKAEQSPDKAHLSPLKLHGVNVSEKRHIRRGTFSINLGKNIDLLFIFFLLGILVYQASLFLLQNVMTN